MKIWKSPKDETRDHMNFLQHLAGSRQVDVTPSGTQGKFDTSVEASSSSLYIKKASGRVPFNASLLTAGQVKFGAHGMSARVRGKMDRNMRAKGSTPMASCQVYDNVYAILENKRAARKAADHFGRPKILSDHLKEVEKSSKEQHQYGYKTTLRNAGKDDTYEVDWNEFRAYVYGAKTLRDIKDPIIEDLVRRNRDTVIGASDTLNPTTTILAALKIASNFWVTEETGGGIGTVPKPPDGEKGEDAIPPEGLTTEPLGEDEASDLEDAIVADTTDDVTSESINKSDFDKDRTVAGIDPLEKGSSFDDVVNDFVDTSEQIKSASALNGRCDGKVNENHRISSFTPSVRLQVELSDTRDVAGKMLGNSGQRVSRNVWKLSAFGDTNVFDKHPYTSSDMIVLADCSSSMGGMWRKRAAEISTAVKERFPDANLYGFRSNRGQSYNADLIPFGKAEYPHCDGSTPLCGAMKGLESLHNLSEASVLIITDGAVNQCYNNALDRDAVDCCKSRASAWRSKGVRFATIYIGYGVRYEPLPVELSVRIEPYDEICSEDVNKVFQFFGR